MSFLSINVVFPYFLNTLGASTLEISLASALVGIGTFISQPYFARKVVGLTYKLKTFIKFLLIQRLFFLCFILAIPFTVRIDPHLTVILFLFCWGIFNFFVGSYSPFFMSLFPKMVPEQQQGRLLGFSGAAGNLISLGCAALISILLERLPFPYNFTCIFAIGIFFLFLDCLDFVFMKEPPDETLGQPMNTREYIRNIPRLLKSHPRYAAVVSSYCLIVISNISLVYYSLYAIRHYHAEAHEIALFTGIGVTINVLGNILYGIIADRYNHRLVMQIATVIGVLAGIVVLSIHSLHGIFLAFALSTLSSCGYFLSSGIFIVQNSSRDRIPVFISTNVMLTLVVSSVVTIMSGYVVDRFSFTPVFILTGLASLGAFVVLTFIYGKVPLVAEKKEITPHTVPNTENL